MKVNTNQKINCYTQGQQFAARVLLILWLLASSNLESALATSESTGDTRAPLLGQPAEDQDPSLSQNAQDNLPTADDKTRQLLDQAAQEQDLTLRQASVSTLAYLATADDRTRQFLHQAAQEQDEDVREIALEALKILEPAPSTLHTEKKRVLQKFFEQAVARNDVQRLSKLILENIDKLGELCESLAVDLLMKTLPQTAATLLTWGVTHNKYELVKFIIEHGRQHINNCRECVGQSVTKIAAQKGYRKLFLLLINNDVDVDTRNITAFMSAIIWGQYKLAGKMIDFGEYRLEQPDMHGRTPQDYLDKKQGEIRIFGGKERQQQAKALEALLHQKIQTMNESNPQEEQQALLKKEQ